MKINGTFQIDITYETAKEILEHSREQMALDFTKQADSDDDDPVTEPTFITHVEPATFDEALAIAPRSVLRPPDGNWVSLTAFSHVFHVSDSTARKWVRSGQIEADSMTQFSGTTWFKTGHVSRWWWEFVETGILPLGRKKSCRNRS